MARRKKQNDGCLGSLANLAAAVLFLIAILLGGAVCFILVGPGADSVFDQVTNFIEPSVEDINVAEIEVAEGMPTLVSVAEFPTPTDTPEFPTLAPTWTNVPDLPTSTPIPLTTLQATLTPSVIPTFPSKTPTPTYTPTPTNTPTASPTGPTPTPSPTRSQYPFTKTVNSPFYLQNQGNGAGCRWMGAAGVVMDLNRNPVPPGSYIVHIWGSGIDERVAAGSAPAYGPSGWEQFLFDSPDVRDYNLQLESANGTVVSQVYAVTTHGSCNENLLQFDFVQNH